MVNINRLERDGLRQAKLCPGNTLMNENIDVLTEICNRILRTGEWPTPLTHSLIIILPKRGNLSSARSISLMSHSSKIMLKVIFNRLKPQAEEIIAEGKA